MEHCRYVCISGGGTKGIMSLGMLRAFDQHLPLKIGKTRIQFFQTILGFSGCSVGSLLALMFLLNLDTTTIENIFHPFLSSLQNIIPRPDVGMLINSFGLDRGEALRDIISLTLRSAGIYEGVTFRDLKRLLHRDFSCVASNLQTQKAVYFSADTSPETKVIDAIVMSCTVPLMFAPLRYQGAVMVDGALTHNMPRNTPIDETLFVEFAADGEQVNDMNHINEFLVSLMMMTLERERTWYSKAHTINLRLPHTESGRELDLSIGPQDVLIRIKSGYASTLTFLYPSFLATIVAVIEMVYELVLEQSHCFPDWDVE